MKKIFLTLISLLLILILAACSGNKTESETAASGADQNQGSPNGNFQLNKETQLLLGTVKLDETDYAVGAEQASQLLPLWKALRSLGESDTAAQAEIDAVISQIEETMTSDQVKAIEAMNLSMQDFASVAQTLGIESGFGAGSFGEASLEMRATAQAMRESGNFPAPPEGAVITVVLLSSPMSEMDLFNSTDSL